VDALGLIGRMLDGMAQGQVPKSAIPPKWPMKGVEDNRIRIDFAAIDKGLNIR
jgi:hypothetical protein